MLKFCLDANVIIKFLVKEADSDKALLLLEKPLREFYSVSFAKIEIFSVLLKKKCRREISSKQVQTAINFLDKLDIVYLPEDNNCLQMAYKMAQEINLPAIYDCLYLACAKMIKASFVTADLVFLKKAKKIYPLSFSLDQAISYKV